MGLVYLRELNSETKLAIWRIEETADELLSRLQLDEREKARLESFGKGKRTLHWLATRVLLRYLLKTEDYLVCRPQPDKKNYMADYPHQIPAPPSSDDT